MSTIIKWIVPCYFNTSDQSDDEMEIDLTQSLKNILKNEVWNRKFNYGQNSHLKSLERDDILKAKITVLPRFISGMVDESRLRDFVEIHCNKVPSRFKVKTYKDWHYANGSVLIEIHLKYSSEDIPTIKENQEFRFKHSFLDTYHKHKSLLKEFSMLFLGGLHLAYPTRSIMAWNNTPLNDGIYFISSKRKKHISKLETDSFMHHILIEKDRLKNVEKNISALSKVWHLNLWSFKRFLIAVNSNVLDMDNLLDLVYSLEGLFNKNASSDFIKMFCVLSLTSNKKEAKDLKNTLDLAFRIRNDIAHGGSYLDGYEKYNLNGKEILAQDIYWEMKVIVCQMLIKAVSKLLQNENLKNLNFNNDDFLEMAYQ